MGKSANNLAGIFWFSMFQLIHMFLQNRYLNLYKHMFYILTARCNTWNSFSTIYPVSQFQLVHFLQSTASFYIKTMWGDNLFPCSLETCIKLLLFKKQKCIYPPPPPKKKRRIDMPQFKHIGARAIQCREVYYSVNERAHKVSVHNMGDFFFPFC